MLGGAVADGATPGASPVRDNLAAAYAEIEKMGLSFDEKKAAMAALDRRVSRDDRFLARAQDDAFDQAVTITNQLGEGFTSIAQIPASVRARMSPQHIASLTTQAAQNVKQEKAPANGDAVINLHRLVELEPEKFLKTNLQAMRPYMTAGEYDTLATLQAKMAKPNSEAQNNHSRIWQFATFYGRSIGIDMSAQKPKEDPKVFQKRLRDGGALFTAMQNVVLSVTEGKRRPTDDEIKKAFDNAVMLRKQADGTALPRFRDPTLPTNAVSVPQSDFLRVQAYLKARGEPYDAQSVSRWWVQNKR